jgi:hypothetical protein
LDWGVLCRSRGPLANGNNPAQDLFEVTSCYYPITFTPPPDDPHGITKDDLREALKYAGRAAQGANNIRIRRSQRTRFKRVLY